MPIHTLSNQAVLSVLVGQTSAKLLLQNTDGCLAPIISETVAKYHTSSRTIARLAAARELVRRGLEEELRARDYLSSPKQVREYLYIFFAGREQEIFGALFLDAQNRLIAAEEMFRGTLTQTSVYPREVVKRALFHNAAAVIFAHNHPSGLAEPSAADESLTETLRRALILIDVRVLDHIIVAGAASVSFAERGLL